LIKGVSVTGTGFVGLVSAVCFAERGFKAYAVTHDEDKAKTINQGEPPFYEPKLKRLLRSSLKSKLFRCTTDLKEAASNSEITFIAVGTPSRPDGDIDLSIIKRSSEEIGEAIAEKRGYHLVVVKSTVVPGTTGGLVKDSVEKHSGKKAGDGFGLCMSPEFLREGKAVYDTFHTDRVVIGEYDRKSGDILHKFYRRFYGKKTPPILRMSLASAEMVKYASNAFLAAKISFINEIARICEATAGVDVAEVAKGMGYDKRIGHLFLEAGLGFGGSCFPKDVRALIAYAQRKRYPPLLLRSILDVNERQAFHGVELAEQLVGSLKGKRVALLGLAFKPETSDIREAASLKIIDRLLGLGAEVAVYDPVAMPEVEKLYGKKIMYAGSPRDCLKKADCCILVTEWSEFKKLKPGDFTKVMRNPAVVDGRKVFNPNVFSKKLRFAAVGWGHQPS
jgi:UDPglucose 6-dehydrogenase